MNVAVDFPRTLSVRLTADDVRRGIAGSAYGCAFALAAARALYAAVNLPLVVRVEGSALEVHPLRSRRRRLATYAPAGDDATGVAQPGREAVPGTYRLHLDAS